MSIIEQVMAARAVAGMRLTWIVDAKTAETFTAYPANAESKAKMIAGGERKGWELIDDSA